jgi:predicted nucleotidyltransferase
MFSVEERERIRDGLVESARADPRVVACALVGSDARGETDRWSDVDVTLGIAAGTAVAEVLEDWTRHLVDHSGAVHLFDLAAGPSLYRVFLFPGNLQVDVSFTPEDDFGPRGPHFRLLFGSAVERAPAEPPSARHLFGFAAHHAVRARICIERRRVWQAEYWISALRDEALTLACRRRGLETAYARGFDRLPPELLTKASQALVLSTEREELLRALAGAVELLLGEEHRLGEDTSRLARQLRELSRDPRSPASPAAEAPRT